MKLKILEWCVMMLCGIGLLTLFGIVYIILDNKYNFSDLVDSFVFPMIGFACSILAYFLVNYLVKHRWESMPVNVINKNISDIYPKKTEDK